MGVLRLGICIGGVYATFLLWAIAQERLSKPFPSTHPHPNPNPSTNSHSTSHSIDKFPSALFLNFAQAIASCLSAVVYLVIGSWRDGTLRSKGFRGVLGIDQLLGSTESRDIKGTTKGETISNGLKHDGHSHSNGTTNTDTSMKSQKSLRQTLPILLLQVSAFQTMAGPIGFSALRHISYPTMVLGKSCKLIPVLLLNVLLYRRRFSPHKYLVVSLVTVGISMFMFFGPKKVKGGGGEDSAWGLGLLLVNLLIDGLTNSTQDQIFTKYPKFTGQQMMFTMSSFTILLLLPTMILPLPTHPLALLHLPFTTPDRISPRIDFSSSQILSVISFITSHPTSLAPLAAYALLGGLGQLFIFETIQHFGSLTLVMVTVTRKLFTMLLSVIVFNHSLTIGQWAGVGVVFGGIGVEAAMKRREMMRRTKKD